MDKEFIVHVGHESGFCGKNQLVISELAGGEFTGKIMLLPISKKIRSEIEATFPDMGFEG